MIYIEPNKVDSNADQITKLGTQMQQKMQEINSTVKSLKADWQDAVQENYDEEFAKLVQSFESFTAQIPNYANEAHAHAEQMRLIGNR